MRILTQELGLHSKKLVMCYSGESDIKERADVDNRATVAKWADAAHANVVCGIMSTSYDPVVGGRVLARPKALGETPVAFVWKITVGTDEVELLMYAPVTEEAGAELV